MFKTIRNAFKVKELRTKILYTFMMLVVIRFGSQLPIPGIETSFFANWFAKQTTDVFGFFNAMTGGSFSSMSIFALSITTYITSSNIIRLLTIAIPKLEELQKDGEDGRKKIQEYTRYTTVGLALIESSAMAIGFGRQGLLIDYNEWNIIIHCNHDNGQCPAHVDRRADYGKGRWKRYLNRTVIQHPVQCAG